MAEDIDSPLEVTRTESAVVIGTERSRDVGLETSFFQGPGESPDMRGEGRGVTSAIALSAGEDKAELGALPTLLLNTFLMLGVRATPSFDGGREKSPEIRAVLLA